MFTWDEVISGYELLERGAKGLERSRLAGCMVQLLPVLREAIEERFPDVKLRLSMLAVELRLPNDSRVLSIQCVDEKCLFRVSFMNHQYEVIQEQTIDLSNAVEQVITYLAMSRL